MDRMFRRVTTVGWVGFAAEIHSSPDDLMDVRLRYYPGSSGSRTLAVAGIMAHEPFTGLGGGTDIKAVPGRGVKDIEVAIHDGGFSCGEGYFPWVGEKREQSAPSLIKKGGDDVTSLVENTGVEFSHLF